MSQSLFGVVGDGEAIGAATIEEAMRKLVIGIAVLLTLVVGALALAVTNVNQLLEENRDRLAALASDTAGRAVRFDRAEVAFSQGLVIRLDGLRVGEDPRFGESDFLALDSAVVGVEFWPALSRRIEVSGVRLEGPTIRLIQTAEGFNFSSLGAAERGSDSAPDSSQESQPLALAIAAFEIRAGTIVFEDQSTDPGLSLTIEDFETSGTDLSLDGPVAITFSGLLRSTQGDSRIASLFEGQLEIEDLDSGAGRLRLRSPSFHPLLLGLQFEDADRIERLDAVDLEIGLPGNSVASSYRISLDSSAGHLAGFDFEELHVKLGYGESKLELERLTIGLAGGKVEVSGDMTFGEAGRSPFDLETRLRDLDLGELVAILLERPRGLVSGRIDGDVSLSGDSLEWETLKRSLAGKVRLEVGQGALENTNLLSSLVNRLVADPGLGALAAQSIRDVAPTALQGDRTTFDSVILALDVAQGAIRADALELETDDFTIRAAGTLRLDGAVSGKGTIRFSEDLSRKILAKAGQLAPLLGEGDVVELPLRLGGSASSPSLRPDLNALAANARASATQEVTARAAQKLTDAIFGKK
ncbi:MAG: AsmA-like C-terminal region-containing protein, partial [Myxococcota bacterium]